MIITQIATRHAVTRVYRGFGYYFLKLYILSHTDMLVVLIIFNFLLMSADGLSIIAACIYRVFFL